MNRVTYKGLLSAAAVILLVSCAARNGSEPVAPDHSPSTSVHQLGTMDGGGGSGVVCRNTDGSLKSVQLLDLFEARNMYGSRLAKDLGSLQANWNAAVTKYIARSSNVRFMEFHDSLHDELTDDDLAIMKQFITAGEIPRDSWGWFYTSSPKYYDRYELEKFWSEFPQKAKFVDETLSLKRVFDTGEVLFNLKSCALEQIVNYQDTGDVMLVQKSLWSALEPLDKAALLFHEFAYRKYREFGVKKSTTVRKLVRRMFSDAPVAPILPVNVNDQNSIVCASDASASVIVIDNSWDGMDKNFQNLFVSNLSNQLVIETASTYVAELERVLPSAPQSRACLAGAIYSKTLPISFDVSTSYFREHFKGAMKFECKKGKEQNGILKLVRSSDGRREVYTCDRETIGRYLSRISRTQY